MKYTTVTATFNSLEEAKIFFSERAKSNEVIFYVRESYETTETNRLLEISKNNPGITFSYRVTRSGAYEHIDFEISSGKLYLKKITPVKGVV